MKYKIANPEQLDSCLVRLREHNLKHFPVYPDRTYNVQVHFNWDWPADSASEVVLFKRNCEYSGFGLAQQQTEPVLVLSDLKSTLERSWLSEIEPNVILKMVVRLSDNDPINTWEIKTELIRGVLTVMCLMPHVSEPNVDQQHLLWINQIRNFSKGEQFDLTMTVDRSAEYFKVMRCGEDIRRVFTSDNRICFEVDERMVADQAAWVPDFISNLINFIIGIEKSASNLKIGVEWSVGFQSETRRLNSPTGGDINKFLSIVRQRVKLPTVVVNFNRWTNDPHEVFEYQSWLKGKENLWKYDSIFCEPQGNLIDPSGKTISVKAEFLMKLEADGVYLIVDSKQDLSWILVDEVGLELVKTKKSKKK